MNHNHIADPASPDTIRVPFIYVPHGHPLPTEWIRDHPDYIRLPAVMVPRAEADGGGKTSWRLDILDDGRAAAPAPDAAAVSRKGVLAWR